MKWRSKIILSKKLPILEVFFIGFSQKYPYNQDMSIQLPLSWQSSLSEEIQKPYFIELIHNVSREYETWVCFPIKNNIFRIFDVLELDKIRVVILGQDPYHTPGLAMWLSFSVPNGSKLPPSLRNIFKELESDIRIHRTNTDLTDWSEQWVFLLNTILSVRSGEPASHTGLGWEIFTDAVITLISEQLEGVVFVLWGNYAGTKKSLIDSSKHHIITSPHPSPFSAHRWFLGSQPFSQINQYLKDQHKEAIVWD